jgi:hypothetical protein
MSNRTVTSEDITIEVYEGCKDCPFCGDTFCGLDSEVLVSHDASWPAKCALLDVTVIVKRNSL